MDGHQPELAAPVQRAFRDGADRADLFPPRHARRHGGLATLAPAAATTADRGLDARPSSRVACFSARGRRKDGKRLRPGQRWHTCHPPPLYTNNQITEVGTRGPLDDHSAYDTPPLTGAAARRRISTTVARPPCWTSSTARWRTGTSFVSDLTPQRDPGPDRVPREPLTTRGHRTRHGVYDAPAATNQPARGDPRE